MENNLKRYLFDYTNDDYYKCDDVDTELTRLRGEVERLKDELNIVEKVCNRYIRSSAYYYNLAETAEAEVNNLRKALLSKAAYFEPKLAQLARYELARANYLGNQQKVEELEAMVIKLKDDLFEADNLNKNCEIILQKSYDTQEKNHLLEKEVQDLKIHNEKVCMDFEELEGKLADARSKLAELRARVRPGVEEVEKEITKFGNWHWLNGSSTQSCVISVGKAHHIAQAIHDILPPVPPSCGVHEIEKIVVESSKGCLDYGLASKSIARSIHKAMGGEE